ncbi:MAG: hypothetical protein DMG76_11420 [Acidobacteria bacterium]|nr:MAG: hypothetical protein DMG76_11420 [Acidobacteriota bacterium]
MPVGQMAPSAIKDHGVTRRSAFLKRTASICSALVAACLLYAALVSMANGLRLARQPYQFDYEEGNVLNAAVRIIAGLTPYPVPQSWPIVLNSYGPIPYLISAGLIRNRKPELFRPRIISLVAATIVAFEIGLLASGLPDSVLLGISLGAFFLTLPLVQEWAPILRVDFLGLAFSLGGLVVFLRLPRLHFGVPFFFAGALLCKVTFLAAPITCVVILVRGKRWRDLTFGMLAGVAVLGIAIAALQWSTHGEFLFHQFGTHVDSLSWTNYRTHASQVLRETAVLVALTLVGIIRRRRLAPPFLYFFFVILGTVTALKVGSESNHFLELEAALCISSATGVRELQKMNRLPFATAGLIVLCGVIFAVEGIANRALYSSQGVVDECPRAYAYIRDHERVLSENVGALVLTGRPVLLSNPFVYAQLVRSGKWPSGRVEQMLEESTADLVIIGKPRISEQRWSQPALAALASNYHVSKRFACPDAMVAYEPNSPRAAPLP